MRSECLVCVVVLVAAQLLACGSEAGRAPGDATAGSGAAGSTSVSPNAGNGADAASTGNGADAASTGSGADAASTGSGGAPGMTKDTDASVDAASALPGERVCGTADESGVVTITCPSGQIVGTIAFASYGDPTGMCGSFVAGTCASTGAVAAASDLCVGRVSCNVPATNVVFGDPCHGMVKHLALEARCVEGTPVTPTQPFKGVANSPCNARTALGVSWYYNWGPEESEPCADVKTGGEFVPMIWGSQVASSIQTAVAGFVRKGYAHVLGFNEPDHSDQANMSVADAITLWPAFDNPAIELVGPAAASDGRTWAQDFMTQVDAKALRVDVFATHWYGWNAGSCDAKAANLESHIAWAEGVARNRPIWLTEWGCLNQSAPDEASVVAFYQGALQVFARHPRVQRYAWYPWATNCGLVDGNGALTTLGKAYAAAPAYR